jgi:hypothetical protein
MLKRFFLPTLLFSCLLGSGQSKTDKAIQLLFDKGQKQVDDSLFSEAIATFKKITEVAKVNSTPYCKATFNIGYLYMMQGDDPAADRVFTQIVASEHFHDRDKGGRGSGIMQEPYALYKHDACECLAQISLRQSHFSNALKYIQLSEKKYPYQHFCGNEMAASRIYTAEMYAKAYCGLHDTAAALRVLLPYVFDNGLASNELILNDVVKLLRVKYEKEELAARLDKAIDSVRSRLVKQEKYEYTNYEIVFLDVPITVPEYFFNSQKLPGNFSGLPELEKRKVIARKSEFYERVAGVPEQK